MLKESGLPTLFQLPIDKIVNAQQEEVVMFNFQHLIIYLNTTFIGTLK